MEELIGKLEEILEVEDLDKNKRFTDFEEWDSLCSLSILAMLDSEYRISMTGKDLTSFESIESFCKKVLSLAKQ